MIQWSTIIIYIFSFLSVLYTMKRLFLFALRKLAERSAKADISNKSDRTEENKDHPFYNYNNGLNKNDDDIYKLPSHKSDNNLHDTNKRKIYRKILTGQYNIRKLLFNYIQRLEEGKNDVNVVEKKIYALYIKYIPYNLRRPLSNEEKAVLYPLPMWMEMSVLIMKGLVSIIWTRTFWIIFIIPLLIIIVMLNTQVWLSFIVGQEHVKILVHGIIPSCNDPLLITGDNDFNKDLCHHQYDSFSNYDHTIRYITSDNYGMNQYIDTLNTRKYTNHPLTNNNFSSPLNINIEHGYYVNKKNEIIMVMRVYDEKDIVHFKERLINIASLKKFLITWQQDIYNKTKKPKSDHIPNDDDDDDDDDDHQYCICPVFIGILNNIHLFYDKKDNDWYFLFNPVIIKDDWISSHTISTTVEYDDSSTIKIKELNKKMVEWESTEHNEAIHLEYLTFPDLSLDIITNHEIEKVYNKTSQSKFDILRYHLNGDPIEENKIFIHKPLIKKTKLLPIGDSACYAHCNRLNKIFIY